MDATQMIFLLVFLAILAFTVLIPALFFILVVSPWLRAFLHGAPVSMLHVIAMRLRGNSPKLLIDAYIALQRAGRDVTIRDVENAYIDGRNRVLTSDDLVELINKRAKAR